MWHTISFMTALLAKNKTRFNHRFNPGYLILFVFVLLLFSQCSKPTGQIGAIIQPEDSKLKLFYTDTSSVYAYSLPQDSIRSDHLVTNMVGSINDPVFGATNAGFYIQFLLSVPNHDFGENPTLDSLVLQLTYNGLDYGDTNTMQTLHVYEMNDSISNDSLYYSNKVVSVFSTDYADFSFVPNPVDSIVVDGDTIAPALRFSLSDRSTVLGEKLLSLSADDMADNETFLRFFNGLYIVAEPVYSNGSLISFDLTSITTNLTIYYGNNDQDSLRYKYSTTSAAARINRFTHNFLSGDHLFKQQVINGDTALGKERFYVQGAGGVKGFIKISDMKSWRNMGVIAINEAKLVLSGAEEKPFNGAPPKLLLYEIREDGSNQFLPDHEIGEDYFGGTYIASSNSYEFRITQYVQSFIDDTTKNNYGLSLYVSKPWYYPNRFIFNGNDTTFKERRLKLNILYTNLSP